MTLVADNVAAKCHVDESKTYLLQIPCVVSTLKKKLCSPGTSQHPEEEINDDDDDGDDDIVIKQCTKPKCFESQN